MQMQSWFWFMYWIKWGEAVLCSHNFYVYKNNRIEQNVVFEPSSPTFVSQFSCDSPSFSPDGELLDDLLVLAELVGELAELVLELVQLHVLDVQVVLQKMAFLCFYLWMPSSFIIECLILHACLPAADKSAFCKPVCLPPASLSVCYQPCLYAVIPSVLIQLFSYIYSLMHLFLVPTCLSAFCDNLPACLCAPTCLSAF